MDADARGNSSLFTESNESLGPIQESGESLDPAKWAQGRPGSRKQQGESGKRAARARVTIAEATLPRIEDDSLPEAPRTSRPVHPSGSWDMAKDDLVEVLSAQHSEVISRLSAQDEILSRLLKVPRVRSVEAATIINEDPVVNAASLFPHPAFAKSSIRSTRSTTRSARSTTRSKEPAVVKPTASMALRPTYFRSFTQIDNSLRYAASAIAASRARRRFASIRMKSNSAGDDVSCVVHIVDHVAFDFFFAFLVLFNCVFIGVEVQHAIEQPHSQAVGFTVVQYVLAFLFAVELVMRLFASGCHEFFCGRDSLWSLLDAFIVLSSIWDVVLDAIYLWDASSSDNPVSTLRALRVLRLARIVKAVRLMRVFRFVRALRTLITSIFHTLKSLFWALVLMVLIVYVFGVLFSQAVNSYIVDPGNDPLPDYAYEAATKHYYSLSGTMLSLFMCISGGVNWENVLEPLRFISQFWVFLFVFYVAFTYFAVLNVLTAVFCQSAIESAQNDQTSMIQTILEEKEAHREKLLDLFVEIGAEQETITFELFQEKINDPAVREYFTSIGLDVWDAWSFFKLLDLDEGGAVEVDEFLMGCLRLRGQARAVDVGKLIYDQTWMIRNQSHFQGYVEVQLKQVKELLSSLTGVRLQSVHPLGTAQP